MEACTRQSGDSRSPARWDNSLRGAMHFITWGKLIWDSLSVNSRCPQARALSLQHKPKIHHWPLGRERGKEGKSKEKPGQGNNSGTLQMGCGEPPHTLLLTKSKCRWIKDWCKHLPRAWTLPSLYITVTELGLTSPEYHRAGPWRISKDNALKRAASFVWSTHYSHKLLPDLQP